MPLIEDMTTPVQPDLLEPELAPSYGQRFGAAFHSGLAGTLGRVAELRAKVMDDDVVAYADAKKEMEDAGIQGPLPFGEYTIINRTYLDMAKRRMALEQRSAYMEGAAGGSWYSMLPAGFAASLFDPVMWATMGVGRGLLVGKELGMAYRGIPSLAKVMPGMRQLAVAGASEAERKALFVAGKITEAEYVAGGNIAASVGLGAVEGAALGASFEAVSAPLDASIGAEHSFADNMLFMTALGATMHNVNVLGSKIFRAANRRAMLERLNNKTEGHKTLSERPMAEWTPEDHAVFDTYVEDSVKRPLTEVLKDGALVDRVMQERSELGNSLRILAVDSFEGRSADAPQMAEMVRKAVSALAENDMDIREVIKNGGKYDFNTTYLAAMMDRNARTPLALEEMFRRMTEAERQGRDLSDAIVKVEEQVKTDPNVAREIKMEADPARAEHAAKAAEDAESLDMSADVADTVLDTAEPSQAGKAVAEAMQRPEIRNHQHTVAPEETPLNAEAEKAYLDAERKAAARYLGVDENDVQYVDRVPPEEQTKAQAMWEAAGNAGEVQVEGMAKDGKVVISTEVCRTPEARRAKLAHEVAHNLLKKMEAEDPEAYKAAMEKLSSVMSREDLVEAMGGEKNLKAYEAARGGEVLGDGERTTGLLEEACARLQEGLADGSVTEIPAWYKKLWEAIRKLFQAGEYPEKASIGIAREILRTARERYGKAEAPAESDIPFSLVEEKVQAKVDREMAEVRAKYAGTDKWLKAPNGEATKLNEHQWLQTRTPSFKQWFGDWENDPANASKVVDANGEPLVVYHGTTADFSVFDPRLGGTETLAEDAKSTMFFTSRPAVAEDFAGYVYYSPDRKNVAQHYYPGANIMPVFLNLRNLDAWSLHKGGYREGFQTGAIKEAIKDGSDGVVFEQVRDGSVSTVGPLKVSDVYAVFDPANIKSATANVGTFDRANPDIRYSVNQPMTEADKIAEAHTLASREYENRWLFVRNLVFGGEQQRTGAGSSITDAMATKTMQHFAATVNALTDGKLNGTGVNLRRLLADRNMEPAIADAMWDINNGRSVAGYAKVVQKTAQILHDTMEAIRQEFRKMGVDVGHLNSFVASTSHDSLAIRAAGKTEADAFKVWRAFILPRLDMAATFAARNVADVEKSLRGMFDGLVSGVHEGAKNDRTLAERIESSALLIFKDAKSWREYNNEFGAGRLDDAIFKSIEHNVRNLAVIRVLGKDPDSAFASMLQQIALDLKHSGRPNALTEAREFTAKRDGMLRMPANVDGTNNRIASREWDTANAWLKTMIRVSKLKSAVVASFADQANLISGIHLTEQRSFLAAIATGIYRTIRYMSSPEQRRYLRQIGAIADSFTSQGLASALDGQSPGTRVNRLASAGYFKVTLLHDWVNMIRGLSADSVMSHFGEFAGKTWDALPEYNQKQLARFDISEADWNRHFATTKAATVDSAHWLTPDLIANKEMRFRYLNLIQHEMRVNSAEPTARTTWALHGGHNIQKGTPLALIVDNLLMFKSYMVSSAQGPLSRIALAAGDETVGRGLTNWKKTPQQMAAQAAMMTFFGGLAYVAKGMLMNEQRSFKDQRGDVDKLFGIDTPWLNERAVAHAFMLGGFASGMPDVLFADWRNFLLGPWSSNMTTAGSIVSGFREDKGNAKLTAIKFAQQNMPTTFWDNYLQNKYFWNILKEYAKPGVTRAEAKKRAQVNGLHRIKPVFE